MHILFNIILFDFMDKERGSGVFMKHIKSLLGDFDKCKTAFVRAEPNLGSLLA